MSMSRMGFRQNPGFAEVRGHAAAAAELLRALANDRRLLVLCTLVDGPLSVGEINVRVPLSQSALSQHLAVLREAGVVTTQRRSRTVTYELAPGAARQVMQALHEAYCTPRDGQTRRTLC